MKSSPQPITGPWDIGLTLDEHTFRADFLGYDSAGHPQFDTTRTEIGEMLFQTKYRANKSFAHQLAEEAAKHVRRAKISVDLVVPLPPSRVRSHQPVLVIGKKLAAELEVAFDDASLRKVKDTPELKSMNDLQDRKKALSEAFDVQGRVAFIAAIALTRTRSRT